MLTHTMPAHWTRNDITVQGARTHYYRAGNGAGLTKPVIVLAHGFSDNGLCWEPMAAELESAYDVFMPDARGHGLSQRVQQGEKLDPPADLAGFIRAMPWATMGLERPIVGGHSMGASTAFQLGARYPELVRALILEDPPWRVPQPGEAGPRGISAKSPLGEWIMRLQDQTLEQVMAQCRIDYPRWPEIVVQRWCEGKKQLDPAFLLTENGSITGSWRDMVPAISCPTLILTADPNKGGIVTPEVAQEVCAANPNFRVAHIPGVGHHVRFGDQATYMRAVWAFLEEIG